MKDSNSDHLIKFAAICSILGAITTALLLFLPRPTAADFESQLLLHDNSLYLARLWILFLHPQVNFIASLGIAYVLVRRFPARIIFGTFFLLVWAYTEMSQQSLLIDGLNQIWRPAYLAAQESADQNIYRTLITGTAGYSDSQYFLVIYGFGLGSLCYGLAFLSLGNWAKWLGGALVFIGLLSLAAFSRYYLGMNWLNWVVDSSYSYIYPYLQPLVRIGLGVWLWRVSTGSISKLQNLA
ncbi:MAG: hypothetical protein AAFP77_04310 [Bacteroidota bacterium]